MLPARVSKRRGSAPSRPSMGRRTRGTAPIARRACPRSLPPTEHRASRRRSRNDKTRRRAGYRFAEVRHAAAARVLLGQRRQVACINPTTQVFRCHFVRSEVCADPCKTRERRVRCAGTQCRCSRVAAESPEWMPGSPCGAGYGRTACRWDWGLHMDARRSAWNSCSRPCRLLPLPCGGIAVDCFPFVGLRCLPCHLGSCLLIIKPPFWSLCERKTVHASAPPRRTSAVAVNGAARVAGASRTILAGAGRPHGYEKFVLAPSGPARSQRNHPSGRLLCALASMGAARDICHVLLHIMSLQEALSLISRCLRACRRDRARHSRCCRCTPRGVGGRT